MALTSAEKLIDAKIHSHSLHIRFDKQLVEMAESHAAKIPHVEDDLEKLTNFKDAVRWELKEQGLSPSEREAELLEQRTYYQWKKDALEETVSLIASEQSFRRDGKVTRTPRG